MSDVSCGLAPIVLFVYNRPEHTRRTVEALRANRLASQSRLIVFSDGPKDGKASASVDAVRQYVDTLDGFASVEVVKRRENQGLAASVIAGVSQVVEAFGKVIVLEDDLITSPCFLDYMNDALSLYEDEDEVASIQAHMFPLMSNTIELPRSFFLPLTGSWGWGAWERSWQWFNPDAKELLDEIRRRGLARRFDLDGAYPYTRLLEEQVAGRIDSWAIRWYASLFLLGKISLFPSVSFVENRGFDGSGVHCGWSRTQSINAVLEKRYDSLEAIITQVDEYTLEAFKRAVQQITSEGVLRKALHKAFYFIRTFSR